MPCACTILSFVACPALTCFSTLSTNGTAFEKYYWILNIFLNYETNFVWNVSHFRKSWVRHKLKCTKVYIVYKFECGICTQFVILQSSCGWAENMVMMMIMMTMISRRRSGYLRTVTFEWACKTLHLLLYSSISVHCNTFNSLFSLPNSTLKVQYRNLPACHFIGQQEQ